MTVIRPGQVRTAIFGGRRLQERRSQLPTPLEPGYGPLFARCASERTRGETRGFAGEEVAGAVLRRCGPPPRLRYLVGADAIWLDIAAGCAADEIAQSIDCALDLGGDEGGRCGVVAKGPVILSEAKGSGRSNELPDSSPGMTALHLNA